MSILQSLIHALPYVASVGGTLWGAAKVGGETKDDYDKQRNAQHEAEKRVFNPATQAKNQSDDDLARVANPQSRVRAAAGSVATALKLPASLREKLGIAPARAKTTAEKEDAAARDPNGPEARERTYGRYQDASESRLQRFDRRLEQRNGPIEMERGEGELSEEELQAVQADEASRSQPA